MGVRRDESTANKIVLVELSQLIIDCQYRNIKTLLTDTGGRRYRLNVAEHMFNLSFSYLT